MLGKCRGGDLGSLFGDVGSTRSYFPPWSEEQVTSAQGRRWKRGGDVEEDAKA